MTMVSFNDKEAISPGGIFTVSACTPENGNIPYKDGSYKKIESWGVFQSNWRLRLEKDNQVIWEKWKFHSDSQPKNLYVSDEGWVIFLAHGYVSDKLLVISPQGMHTFTLGIANSECEENGNMYKKNRMNHSKFTDDVLVVFLDEAANGGSAAVA